MALSAAVKVADNSYFLGIRKCSVNVMIWELLRDVRL